MRCQAVRGPDPPLQIVSASDEVRVELAGDVALQRAHDLAGGSTVSETTRDVFAGAFITAHAGEHDPPQRMVCLAVPARVQAVAVNLPRRRGQRSNATEMSERGFVLQSVRVVARGDQQDRGGVGPDAVDLEQTWRGRRTKVSSSSSSRLPSASRATTRRASVAIASFVA